MFKSVFVGSDSEAVVTTVRAAVRAADAHLTVVDTPMPDAQTDLLVLDVGLPHTVVARLIATARQSTGRQPVIFVSVQDSLDARLKAVRAGGAVFFGLPVETAWFGEAIRELLRMPDDQPYRALLIDNDASTLELYRHHLSGAGFEVKTIADPRAGYGEALLFSPDVVFLEIFMPGVDGLELLSVFRQHPGFSGTQVVLVSTEQSLTGRIEAMSHGAQNYLVKPVYPHDLVQTGLNNAARSRTIRNLLARDTLTGLFNHGRIHELAEREFARHKRSGADFTMVVIDLDRFKQINDTHGRAAGDAALKHFAAHLQRTVRRSDCAGRTGGDEFMLLLPDTNKVAAQTLIAKLRALPLTLEFGGASIALNFSCGIADSAERANPGAAITAADAALHDAKRRSVGGAVA